MLIINADDWGRSPVETAAVLRCYQEGRITSVSAMMFMGDSERAAQLAKENELDVGLHLNLAEPFTGKELSGRTGPLSWKDCPLSNSEQVRTAGV